MSFRNKNIVPRHLSYEERENRKKGIYDSFANYLVFCPKCKYCIKTNMYVMRAEAYINELHEKTSSVQNAAQMSGRWATPSERSRDLLGLTIERKHAIV